jgi:DNA-binding transcriptional LysR family regulator
MFVTAAIVLHHRSVELQQLRYVVAVAETSSFTRAAERCLVVQSALSHQIARLERELGARLFERTSRRVRLTPAGVAFLPSARHCLDAAERAVAEVAATVGEVRGPLRVGVIPVVSAVDVPRALRDFHRRHPQPRVSLRVGVSAELIERVRDQDLEVAFVGLPAESRPEGVAGRELKRERLVAVAAPGHRIAGARSVDLRGLAVETFVDWPAGTAGRVQSDQAFAAAGLTREVGFEVSNIDHVARFVRQGLGIALLPAGYAATLRGTVAVKVRDAPVRVEWVVWNRVSRSPATEVFLEIVDRSRAVTA